MNAPLPDGMSAGSPTLATPAAYHRLAKQLAAGPTGGRPLRIAVLSTYTAGFLTPFLTVELAKLGIDATLWFGGFGQLETLTHDAASPLFAFRPDVIVVAQRIEDLVSAPLDGLTTTDDASMADVRAHTIGRMVELVRGVQRVHPATVLISNFVSLEPSPVGVGSGSIAASRDWVCATLNAELQGALQRAGGAYVWDYAGLVATRGRGTWCDQRLWLLARVPIAAPHHPAMGMHLARTIRAAVEPVAKVLVLDLDNTLWGGVLGDDGIHGIQLSDEYPGSEFKALQRQVRALRDRGILLALSSKNDHALAAEAFATHQELVLRWEDFAATRINWGPKSTGIREMAEELNLGLDAFVFLDDNPIERAEVRQMLPQVKVIEHEPWGSMRDALANCPWFDTLSLVEEDRVRAHLYTQDRQRQQAQSNFGTVEEFLRDLAMVVEVGEVQAAERGRVAQLIKKTNQFNLTGRRHSEAALAAWGEPDSGHHVAYLRLRDRFGDQGLVAAAILRRDDHRAHIDTFLMSCRVMNRHVELALLSHLATVARAWGCEQLTGEYIASPRNQMVSGFYASAGFTVGDGDAVLALRESDVPWPVHITRAERG